MTRQNAVHVKDLGFTFRLFRIKLNNDSKIWGWASDNRLSPENWTIAVTPSRIQRMYRSLALASHPRSLLQGHLLQVAAL
jgi:hypothetical protein